MLHLMQLARASSRFPEELSSLRHDRPMSALWPSRSGPKGLCWNGFDRLWHWPTFRGTAQLRQQHPDKRTSRTPPKLRQFTWSGDNQVDDRDDCCSAAITRRDRHNGLASIRARRDHNALRPPLLILIAAPFSPRLSRHTRSLFAKVRCRRSRSH